MSTLLVRSQGEGFATLQRAAPDMDTAAAATIRGGLPATAAVEEEAGMYDELQDDFSIDVEGYEEEDQGRGAGQYDPLSRDEDILHAGTQVLFLREQVAVWPSSRHCILGRLSLVKQASVMFIAWLPYGRAAPHTPPASTARAAAEAVSRLSHAERARYAVHPIALSEVYALHCRTPLLLVASLVLVLQDGLSLPPLHFHTGGLRELIACLKKHECVAPAPGQRNMLLVKGAAEPLPRALATSLELEEAIGLFRDSSGSDATAGGKGTGSVAGHENSQADGAKSSMASLKPGDGKPAGPSVSDSGQASVMAATAAAASATAPRPSDANEPKHLSASDGLEGSTPWAQWLRGVRRRVRAAAAAVASSTAAEYAAWQESLAEGDVAAAAFFNDLLDFETPGAAAAAVEAARVARATAAAAAAGAATYAAAADGCSAVVLQTATGSTKSVTATAGVAGAGNTAALARPEATTSSAAPAALDAGAAAGAGASEAQGGDADDAHSSAGSVDGFELVSVNIQMGSSFLQHSARVQLPPLSADEWQALFDQGRLADLETLRCRAYGSGIDPAVRPEAWKFLLGLYSADSTEEERRELMAKRRREYQALRAQWESISPAQASRNDHWRERCVRINKDARRTDRHLPFFALERGPNVAALRRILLTYAMYNFNLGYCQGMSDFAAPLLYVLCDEVEAFWCFAALMERMGCHFDESQSGVQAQLRALKALLQVLDPPLHTHLESLDALSYFFCFRWLLVMFKREFRQEEVLRLWEAAWACPFSGHLPVFLAAAVLVHHRRDILANTNDLDDLLKMCCQLQGQLQLEPLLLLAERLAGYAAKAGVDVATMPGLPTPPPLAHQHLQ